MAKMKLLVSRVSQTKSGEMVSQIPGNLIDVDAREFWRLLHHGHAERIEGEADPDEVPDALENRDANQEPVDEIDLREPDEPETAGLTEDSGSNPETEAKPADKAKRPPKPKPKAKE